MAKDFFYLTESPCATQLSFPCIKPGSVRVLSKKDSILLATDSLRLQSKGFTKRKGCLSWLEINYTTGKMEFELEKDKLPLELVVKYKASDAKSDTKRPLDVDAVREVVRELRVYYVGSSLPVSERRLVLELADRLEAALKENRE